MRTSTLGSRSAVKGDVPEEWRLKYLGGRGINSLLLYSALPALSPQSVLHIDGRFTGAAILHSDGLCSYAKSAIVACALCVRKV